MAVAKPYDVLSIYRHANGGAGQYRIGLQESTSGSCSGQATLRGATMTVTDQTADRELDGQRAGLAVERDAGATWSSASARPTGRRTTSRRSTTTAGPGTWEIRLEENNGGGQASFSAAALTVTGIQCDAGCGVVVHAGAADGGRQGRFAGAVRGGAPARTRWRSRSTTPPATRTTPSWSTALSATTAATRARSRAATSGPGPTATFTAPPGNVWFNVLWVNEAGAAGSPGSSSTGPRTWSAAGLCGVIDDDTSDPVCD